MLHAANTRVKTFECPSDNPYAPLSKGPIDGLWTEPGGIYYDFIGDVPGFGHECGRANYLGCAGYNGANGPSKGVYYNNSQTRVAEISDGTSNTIAFGETLGGNGGIGQPRDFSLTWFGASSLPSEYGLPGGNQSQYNQFSSKHTGGIIEFAFADGSVRPITSSASYNAFVSASGMQDGQVYNPSDLGQ